MSVQDLQIQCLEAANQVAPQGLGLVTVTSGTSICGYSARAVSGAWMEVVDGADSEEEALKILLRRLEQIFIEQGN